MPETLRILPLSSEAVSQIQSSKQITSLQGVILALLENSLDAASNRIEVTVDFRKGACTVEDNGSGILPAEFSQDGGLAQMYHTSKRNSVAANELHGRNGTYLASLAALSLLNITSSHIDDNRQATLTIHQGKVVRRDVPLSAAHETAYPTSHGTCVSVRDLFGNMPVRVKQRALAAGVSGDNDRAWRELKRSVVALLLAWPNPCAIRLRDEENENKVVQLAALHPAVTTALTEKSLNTLEGRRAKFELEDTLPVLFQAGLTGKDSRGEWIPISATTSTISVKGLISLDPAPTKRCQFISIGVRPYLDFDGYGGMYDSINKLFANSSFGSLEDVSEIDEAEKDRRKHDRRFKQDSYTQRHIHGRKGVDRWPMFVLRIHFKDPQSRGLDVERMSDAGLKAIDDILVTMTTQWLAANHFRHRQRSGRKNEEQESPANALASTEYSLDTTMARSRPNTPAITTPNAKGTATSRPAITAKKRKVVDVNDDVNNFRNRDSAASSISRRHFNFWSRIKSAKSSFYEDVWEAEKSVTAPAQQTRTNTNNGRRWSGHGFQLPDLNVGEFSSKAVRATKNSVDEQDKIYKPELERKEQHISSDDYGSFDDSDILAALGNSDGHHLANRCDETIASTIEEHQTCDEEVEWIDSVSKQKFKVNARTGMVLPSATNREAPLRSPAATREGESRHSAAIDTRLSSAGNPLSLARRPKSSKEKELEWLPGFLQDWNNPVFAQPDEERIPVAYYGGIDINTAEATAQTSTHDTRTDTGAAASTTSKLTKAALKRAIVIRQVDRKYILCKASSLDTDANAGTLILIDQHAASERVILEGLLSELCAPVWKNEHQSGGNTQVILLEKPLRFDVSEADFQRFSECKQYFSNWGIGYELAEKAEIPTASQVRVPKRCCSVIVRHLPPGIAERCVLVPKLLIDLMRSEIWTTNDAEKTSRLPAWSNIDHEEDGDEHSWLKQIGSCPGGIIEMLNSRACRSAIMFNDELSTQECEQLVSKLSECAFPFMCAHGRVSMVPIAEIGVATGEEVVLPLEGESSVQGFADSFKTWKGRRRSESSNGTNP